MQFPCYLDKIKNLKKSVKIETLVEKENKHKLENIYNFKGMPIVISLEENRHGAEAEVPAELDNIVSTAKATKIVFVIDNKHEYLCRGFLNSIEKNNNRNIVVGITIDEEKQKEVLRAISPEQRRKIYSLFGDISGWSGEGKDNIKETMKEMFCTEKQYEGFSLSDVDASIANEFIEFVIEFCFENGIGLKEHPKDYFEDTEKYIAMCYKYGKCAICGNPGETHHWDSIGRGRDRKKVDDSDLRKLPLCREHHTEAHNMGKESFKQKYHIEGIVVT